MRNVVVLISILVAAPASAAPVWKAGRPGYGAPPELKAKYDELAKQKQRPARSKSEGKALEGAPRLSTVGRLDRADDGSVLLSVPISPEQRVALLRLGAQEVTRDSDVGGDTIYGDRYTVRYRLAPEVNVAAARVGQEVRLELFRDAGGRTFVASISMRSE